MFGLGSIAFLAPWFLGLAILLPVIWWLLRLLPPAPKLIRFPAIRLLLGLKPDEETPRRLPIWLAILRLALAALVIGALAQPVLNPVGELDGNGPLVLVIDDGWASAPGWSKRQNHLESLIDKADRADRNVLLLTTAPPALDDVAQQRGMLRAGDARALVRAMKPKPWPTDRAQLAKDIDAIKIAPDANVVWMSDGLKDPGAPALANKLSQLGHLQVLLPDADTAPIMLLPPVTVNGEVKLRAERPPGGPALPFAVLASDDQGHTLARIVMNFATDAKTSEAPFTVPTELRNRVTRLDVERQNGAGSAVLVDERFRRRPVGIVGDQPSDSGSPLLNEVYYLDRALSPFASISIGDVNTLLADPLAVLLLPDSAAPSDADRDALQKWIEGGGIVVRFAGPRLAGATDDAFAPVQLRAGDRALGGAMTWGEPAKLAPFPDNSPFVGLAVPDDVKVNQQVLAEPNLELADRTWARLTDGTPIVTAQKRGQGWLVLVHTSANASWSNLPFSGLFVEMLQRVVALSRGVSGTKFESQLRPWRTMDGFGRLTNPPVGARPLTQEAASKFMPSPSTPPGLYGDEGAQQAFNLGGRVGPLEGLSGFPNGAVLGAIEAKGETNLVPIVLTTALILLLIDMTIALWLRGLLPAATRLRRVARSAAPMIALIAFAGLASMALPHVARAQNNQGGDSLIVKAALETRLAYVVTGNADVDNISHAGLIGLGQILRQRTTVEPSDPIGLDLDRDELRLFPFIYWPITSDQPTLSKQGIAAVDRYLKQGGIILFDTRDALITGGQTGVGPGGRDLRRLLQGIEIPPLKQMAKDHVLTRSFYLLSEFPGRSTGGQIWLEAGGGRINDGVSSLVIGANDWAAAWAVDSRGDPLLPVSPGGENQRELAYRFGVNMVMYALTGNYKDDLVHLPKILERLVR